MLRTLCYASLAEKTRTPPRNYSLVVFFYRDELFERLPPGGRDALRKYAGGIFLAKAGIKLCLRPGPKAVAAGD
jgi:hypothetical protein